MTISILVEADPASFFGRRMIVTPVGKTGAVNFTGRVNGGFANATDSFAFNLACADLGAIFYALQNFNCRADVTATIKGGRITATGWIVHYSLQTAPILEVAVLTTEERAANVLRRWPTCEVTVRFTQDFRFLSV